MNTLPSLPCYLNGEYTTLPDAKISVMDRGFIFGDGAYEVVPCYRGKPFRFDQHMQRLERTLKELRIVNPMTREQWLQVIEQLLNTLTQQQNSSETPDQLIYIQVTRGVAMRDHPMLPGLTPTVFVMTNLMKQPSSQERTQGVSCVTADDFRWEKAHLKTTSLLGAVFARQISVDAQAIETIMFRNGFLSEAAACNVWVVNNGVVYGSPKDNLVLEGIRYNLLEDLCKTQGIPFELKRVAKSEVMAADEVMLSSATKEVLPVTLLDGQPVGTGLPGPVYGKLFNAYQTYKNQF
jgi:D-alanine transaminase